MSSYKNAAITSYKKIMHLEHTICAVTMKQILFLLEFDVFNKRRLLNLLLNLLTKF